MNLIKKASHFITASCTKKVFSPWWLSRIEVLLTEVSQINTNTWSHLYVEFFLTLQTYLQDRNRLIDIENKLVVSKRNGGIN